MTALPDVLDAVREALQVPPPRDFAHRAVRDRIRSRRADYVCGVLEQATTDDPGTTVRALRRAPALFPVNYQTAEVVRR